MCEEKLIEVMEDVKEYGAEIPVELVQVHHRMVIKAYTEARHHSTLVDLYDVLEWIINTAAGRL